MAFGLDYVTGPPAASMKAAGVAFVCRYLSFVNEETRVKLLTADEAKTNAQVGIATVSNYEWYASRATEGSASGVTDAQIARDQHTACGGPGDRPIYFSVDQDVDGSQVAGYFRGIAGVIGLSRTGAYGSYRVIKYLFDQGLITWGWQTYAWSNGAWDSRAHIQQYQNSMTLGGASVDYNRSTKADFGQWFPGGISMPVPQDWQDNGSTLTAPNGVSVVYGFRQHILDAPSWDAGNQPQEAEYHADQVLLHNSSVGPGQRQIFRDNMLWWTSAAGVVQEPYLGLEIDSAYKLIADQQAQIATLQAQLAAATSPTVDTTALQNAINAIPDEVAKTLATSVANALVLAQKL